MAKPRLFQTVADKIIELIENGAFLPGTRLPGERELSGRFGVSRVAIREAGVALQAIGRIKMKAGSGAYVCGPAPKEPRQLPQFSAFELTEARSLFECEAAALAAEMISDDDLVTLREVLCQIAQDDLEDDVTTALDRLFHLTIAAASDNKAIVYVIEILWRMRADIAEVRQAYTAISAKTGYCGSRNMPR